MSKSILHIVFKGLNNEALVKSCSASIAQEDAILLIEDGVYWALRNPRTEKLLSLDGVRQYALSSDVQARARGLELRPSVSLVDYDGMVELTDRHDQIVSWF